MGVTVNRIVYVGADENIFTINPDGSGSKRLTGSVTARSMGSILAQPQGQSSVLHTWPTWSPDGARIAVSRVVFEGEEPQVSLFVIDADTGALNTIYENEAGASPIIADSVPHYMYWSPDAEKLAFIASTALALVLFVNDGSENVVVSSEGPLYFKWAGDGGSMVIHSGDELSRAVAPFDAPAAEIASMSPIFRAPDLSADGQTAAYITGVEQGYGLLTGRSDGSEAFRELMPVGAPAALLWSPNEDVIAVVDGARPGSPGYRRLRLVNPEGGEPTTLVEEPLASFYWSPDGKHIAYVAIDVELRRLVWKVVSTSGGEPWELATFIPSQGMLTAISFFDQYAHSHSFWSPDGESLVFAGQTSRGSQESNGATPDEGSVYVINTEPGSLPRRIASGTLAFWSWN
jgi:Tol biopolymer transport system component